MCWWRAAISVENLTGSRTPGKAVDLIQLRTDRTHVTPLNNAYGAIVTGMDTSMPGH